MRASFYLFLAIATLAVVVRGEDAEDAVQGSQPDTIVTVSTELHDMFTNLLFQYCTFSFFQEETKERGFGKFFKKIGQGLASGLAGGSNEYDYQPHTLITRILLEIMDMIEKKQPLNKN